MTQKPLFPLDAPGVAGEGAVATDHPMTGDNNADGVRTIRGTHRSRCASAPQQLSQLAVVDDLTAGDLA